MRRVDYHTIGYIALSLLVAASSPAAMAAESSRGGSFLALGWDAKGEGLGGAASVLVRDAESAYWNPANLVHMQKIGIGIGSVQLVEGLQSRFSTLAIGGGIGEQKIENEDTQGWYRFALALSASTLGLELADDSSWRENSAAISAAFAFASFSSVGITMRGLWNDTDIADSEASGWAIDFGVAERISRHVWFAIAAHNIASGVYYPERSETIDPAWNFAIAALSLPWNASIEFDTVIKRSAIDKLLLGAQLPLHERYLSILGGLEVRLKEGERTIPAFGFSSSMGPMEVSAAFRFDPLDAFGRRTNFSLSFAL